KVPFDRLDQIRDFVSDSIEDSASDMTTSRPTSQSGKEAPSIGKPMGGGQTRESRHEHDPSTVGHGASKRFHFACRRNEPEGVAQESYSGARREGRTLEGILDPFPQLPGGRGQESRGAPDGAIAGRHEQE